jgi:hypothetical protein
MSVRVGVGMEFCAQSIHFRVLYILFLGGKASGRYSGMIGLHVSPGTGFVCHLRIVLNRISVTFSSINPDEQRVRESTKMIKSCCFVIPVLCMAIQMGSSSKMHTRNDYKMCPSDPLLTQQIAYYLQGFREPQVVRRDRYG